jgi:hypothetical protein
MVGLSSSAASDSLRASAALFKLAGMMRRLEKLLEEPKSR